MFGYTLARCVISFLSARNTFPATRAKKAVSLFLHLLPLIFLAIPAGAAKPGLPNELEEIVTIEATLPKSPPAWATLQRRLLDTMSEAGLTYAEEYTRSGGTLVWKTSGSASPDDLPESFYNFPLLYALGGDERLLRLSFDLWNATTRQLANDFDVYEREFPKRGDWMHLGELLIYFYYLALADPTDWETYDRARKFAAMYMGEDPKAPNYDPEKNIIRSPHTGSIGPTFGDPDNARPYHWSKGMSVYGLPLEDLPGIKDVEDLKDPETAQRMGRAMAERFYRGDTPVNMAATSLAVNAYLFDGDEKYAEWVRKYVRGWLERTRANGGITPDNVGLSGEVGEYHEGRWWGGNYGWRWPHGYLTLGMPFQIGAANAMLVSEGDESYLEMPRSNLDALLENARHHKGTFIVPYKRGEDGWYGYRPLERIYPASLWYMSMDDADWARIEGIRKGQKIDWHTATGATYPDRGQAVEPEAFSDCFNCDINGLEDWTRVPDARNKTDTGRSGPWLRFLAGENPEYPEKALRTAYGQMAHRLKMIREDTLLLEYDARGTEHIDPEWKKIQNVHEHHWLTVNPVSTEALIHLTLGAPQIIYNGGILHARVRYFDPENRRPGLPADVAALVRKVEEKRTVLELVNTSPFQARSVILQGGMFGEHRFGEARFRRRSDADPIQPRFGIRPPPESEVISVRVDRKFFRVKLPPGTGILLDVETRRYAQKPSYAFPWHGEEIAIR